MKVNWKGVTILLIAMVLLLLAIILFYGGYGAIIFKEPWLWGGALAAALFFLAMLGWIIVRLIGSEDGLIGFLASVTKELSQQPTPSSERPSSSMSSELSEVSQHGDIEPQPELRKRDLGVFIRYMQRRMDFVAQVSTSAPSWCLTMTWLEFLGEFFKQFYLLDNIARTHLAKGRNHETIYGNKLLIKWNYKKAELRMNSQGEWECKVNEHWQSLNRLGEISNGSLKELRQSIEGLRVDIPHGYVGAQAFYSIVENLIRNTAKYGDSGKLQRIKEEGEELEFTILVQDDEDDWDDGQQMWKETFYKVSIFDNLPTEPGTEKALNKYVAADIIEPTGEVKPGEWGMKEIKICSAYLRLVRPEDIDSRYKEWERGTREEPPLFKYTVKKYTGNTNNLVCVLYLFRPKEALLVGKCFNGLNEGHRLFRRQGIDFLNDFERLKREVEAGVSYRHNFLVVDNQQREVDWKWLEHYINCLPYRIIVVGDIPQNAGVQIQRTSVPIQFNDIKDKMNDPNQLVNFLWEKWVQCWWRQFKVVARIGDPGDMKERIDECVQNDRELQNALVFDHDWENQDESQLYKSAIFHWSLRRRGDDSAYTQLISGNRWRIKETAAITVAILDDRIYKERESQATYGVDRYSDDAKILEAAWRKRRVYLLNDQTALKDFGQFVGEVKELVQNDAKCKFFDFLVIHQGIIDGIKDNQGEDTFQKNWGKLKNLFRWVVIDTGRGVPQQAQIDRLRWVEYSNIADCLVQGASDKFPLAHVLFSLRTTHRLGVM